MTRSEKVTQQKRLHNRYTNLFRSPVKKALKAQYDQYVSSLKSHGAQYVLSHPVAKLIDPGLSNAIQHLYVVVATGKAAITLRELNRLPKVEKKAGGSLGFNAEWTNQVLDYFQQHLFDKVVLPISQSTQDYILKTIREGVAEGWSVDRMVLQIERQDFLDGRVERILRTEINRAIAYGDSLGADSYDFKTKKEWISVHDSRTRHAHLVADGQVVPENSKFVVWGESLDQPGDPTASARNVINCRCTRATVADRDNRGRLVPKVEAPPVERLTGQLREDILAAIEALTS